METVPLVIYENGKRKVIGKATIRGAEVTGAFYDEAVDLVRNHLVDNGGYFSIAAPFETDTDAVMSLENYDSAILHPVYRDPKWQQLTTDESTE